MERQNKTFHFSYFKNISKATIFSFEFFKGFFNGRYGTSPDGSGSADILVQTNESNQQPWPTNIFREISITFIQYQLQMACSDTHSCILVSYQPKTNKVNFFFN